MALLSSALEKPPAGESSEEPGDQRCSKETRPRPEDRPSTPQRSFQRYRQSSGLTNVFLEIWRDFSNMNYSCVWATNISTCCVGLRGALPQKL